MLEPFVHHTIQLHNFHSICLDSELNVFTRRLVIPGDYAKVYLVWSIMRFYVTAFDVTGANGSKVNLLKMIRIVRVRKIVNSRAGGKGANFREYVRKQRKWLHFLFGRNISAVAVVPLFRSSHFRRRVASLSVGGWERRWVAPPRSPMGGQVVVFQLLCRFAASPSSQLAAQNFFLP